MATAGPKGKKHMAKTRIEPRIEPRIKTRTMRKARTRTGAARPARPATKRRARRRVVAASESRKRAVHAAPRRQTFVASHFSPDAFEEGLRAYAKYRDLGIAAATGGLARAHVIKMIPPCDPAVVSKRHYHDVEFQMIYVLKGWIKAEYEGAGVVTMREGSCWLQPPKIKHAVLDYSADCELLEIILPADFATVELE
jgi:mannose-6-phosphate isomerase-like protein (cupin superfamily)